MLQWFSAQKEDFFSWINVTLDKLHERLHLDCKDIVSNSFNDDVHPQLFDYVLAAPFRDAIVTYDTVRQSEQPMHALSLEQPLTAVDDMLKQVLSLCRRDLIQRVEERFNVFLTSMELNLKQHLDDRMDTCLASTTDQIYSHYRERREFLRKEFSTKLDAARLSVRLTENKLHAMAEQHLDDERRSKSKMVTTTVACQTELTSIVFNSTPLAHSSRCSLSSSVDERSTVGFDRSTVDFERSGQTHLSTHGAFEGLSTASTGTPPPPSSPEVKPSRYHNKLHLQALHGSSSRLSRTSSHGRAHHRGGGGTGGERDRDSHSDRGGEREKEQPPGTPTSPTPTPTTTLAAAIAAVGGAKAMVGGSGGGNSTTTVAVGNPTTTTTGVVGESNNLSRAPSMMSNLSLQEQPHTSPVDTDDDAPPTLPITRKRDPSLMISASPMAASRASDAVSPFGICSPIIKHQLEASKQKELQLMQQIEKVEQSLVHTEMKLRMELEGVRHRLEEEKIKICEEGKVAETKLKQTIFSKECEISLLQNKVTQWKSKVSHLDALAEKLSLETHWLLHTIRENEPALGDRVGSMQLRLADVAKLVEKPIPFRDRGTDNERIEGEPLILRMAPCMVILQQQSDILARAILNEINHKRIHELEDEIEDRDYKIKELQESLREKSTEWEKDRIALTHEKDTQIVQLRKKCKDLKQYMGVVTAKYNKSMVVVRRFPQGKFEDILNELNKNVVKKEAEKNNAELQLWDEKQKNQRLAKKVQQLQRKIPTLPPSFATVSPPPPIPCSTPFDMMPKPPTSARTTPSPNGPIILSSTTTPLLPIPTTTPTTTAPTISATPNQLDAATAIEADLLRREQQERVVDQEAELHKVASELSHLMQQQQEGEDESEYLQRSSSATTAPTTTSSSKLIKTATSTNKRSPTLTTTTTTHYDSTTNASSTDKLSHQMSVTFAGDDQLPGTDILVQSPTTTTWTAAIHLDQDDDEVATINNRIPGEDAPPTTPTIRGKTPHPAADSPLPPPPPTPLPTPTTPNTTAINNSPIPSSGSGGGLNTPSTTNSKLLSPQHKTLSKADMRKKSLVALTRGTNQEPTQALPASAKKYGGWIKVKPPGGATKRNSTSFRRASQSQLGRLQASTQQRPTPPTQEVVLVAAVQQQSGLNTTLVAPPSTFEHFVAGARQVTKKKKAQTARHASTSHGVDLVTIHT